MPIIWNKVTWYSKLLSLIVFIFTVWFFVWAHSEYKEIKNPEKIPAHTAPVTNNTRPKPATAKPADQSASDGTYCFARIQKATKSEPYAVEEHIKITITGSVVTGTKSGTQNGPDMTNGYQGTLSGTRTGSALSLVYAYTIEGSRNKEQEEYVLENNTLQKKRYQLVEDLDVLVPDTSKPPTLQEYTKENCS